VTANSLPEKIEVYPQPPRFAADRCLAKRVPCELIHHGWDITLITDVFANEAQSTPDDVWLEWASRNLDAALTKDKAIRRSAWFSSARIPIFCLSRQDLKLDEMVSRFTAHRSRIWKIASDHSGRQWWTIYADSMERLA